MSFNLFKSEEKKNDDFFESYSNKGVIGFKPSWVSEITNDMKEIYEKKEDKNIQDRQKEKK